MNYGSVKGAFKSLPLPPLKRADDKCVQLMPAYHSALRRDQIMTKQIHNWTNELSLQGCFDITDCGMFKKSCSGIDKLPEIVSGYVTFCEDCVITKKSVKIFPDSTPWVSKSLKNPLTRNKKTTTTKILYCSFWPSMSSCQINCSKHTILELTPHTVIGFRCFAWFK